jgi:type IV pilus assembly protein PilW
MKNIHNHIKQSGISMVEVLVALVISLFLLGGIVQVYVGNKTTFAFTSALAEVQENGRFAVDMMSQDLRLSGEWGCINFDPSDTSNVNNTLDAVTMTTTYNSILHDYDSRDGIEATENDGLNGSDSITIRGGKTVQANIVSPFRAATNASIVSTLATSLERDDILLIQRCGANDLLIDEEADILQVTAVDHSLAGGTKTDITLSAPKSQLYQNDASLIELQTVTYSIAAGASGQPALWRADFANNQELVEGVQEMQILYGIDTDVPGDQFPNRYVDSTLVGANFQNVVAIRVMLLVRSIDDFVTEAPQTYTWINGAQILAPDRRLYQVFSNTIALRNRIGSL